MFCLFTTWKSDGGADDDLNPRHFWWTHKRNAWMIYVQRETDMGLVIVWSSVYSRSEARDNADMAQLVRALVS